MDIRQGKLPTGKGMFLWTLFRLLGHTSWKPALLSDMAILADQLKTEGYNWVAIKVVHGRVTFDPLWRDASVPSQQDYLAALVPELKRVGIELHLWGYYYGSHTIIKNPKRKHPITIYKDQTPQEIDRTLEQIAKWKPLSFIINAEKQFRDWAKRNSRAESLMKGIREGMALTNDSTPDIPIGFSSFKFPRSHPKLPWATFGKYVDYWAPQVYWEGQHNPVEQLGKSIAQHLEIMDLPIIPAGSAYPSSGVWDFGTGKKGWVPTVEDFDKFDARVQELGLLGIHYWEYHYMEDTPEWQVAIAAHDWGSEPIEPPTPPDPPLITFPLPVVNDLDLPNEVQSNREAINELARLKADR